MIVFSSSYRMVVCRFYLEGKCRRRLACSYEHPCFIVCPFYKEGNCRYGDRCWNLHPSGYRPNRGNKEEEVIKPKDQKQSEKYGGNKKAVESKPQGQKQPEQYSDGGNREKPSGGGNHYNKYKWTVQNNQSQQQTFTASATDVLSRLAGDMKEWGESQMWPFSCVALDKGLPCIPELEDTSFEELRYLAYEARRFGTLETYKQNVVRLAADFSRKRDMLINPSISLKQTLNSLLEDSTRKNSSFGASSISKLGTSLFSSGPEQGQKSQQNMFCQQQSSVGASGSQSSGSAFGGPQPQAHATGLFCKPSPSLGVSQNGFGKFQLTNGFAQSTSTSKPQFDVFGAVSDTGSAAGSSTAPAGVSNVGFSNTTGRFSGSSTRFSGGGFGNSTASLFNPFDDINNPQTVSMGNQALLKPEGTGGFSSNANSVYTDISELTAEELEAFKAPKFTLGNIPMKPPPRELC